jgi:C1A family cysteine protease
VEKIASPVFLKETRMKGKQIHTENKDRKHAWIPDIPDFRDYPYSLIATAKKPEDQWLAFAPVDQTPSYDLRRFCSPVDDQGKYASCVLNAETSAMEFLILKSGMSLLELSRFFAYYNCRAYQGNVNADYGTSMRTGIQMLAQYGVCPELEWPYIDSNFSLKPTAKCYSDALPHKVTSYYRLSSVDTSQMLDCLSQGYPFVFGLTLYSGWWNVANTGVLNLPVAGETRVGGHGVMAVGNIASQQRIIARNSYGPAWGKQGYFTIPYSYLTNMGLAGDFWTIRRS